MQNIYLLAFILFCSNAIGQSYNGPESVDYDEYGNRYLISNSLNGQILALMFEEGEEVLEVFINSVGGAPHGLEVVEEELYVCSDNSLKAYNLVSEEQTVNVNLGASFANGITHKGKDVFVTDFLAKKIYRYNILSGNFNVYLDGLPKTPNGILYDDIQDRLLVVCWGNNAPIYEIDMADSSYTTVATTSLGNCDGIAMDNNGDFYVSAWSNNAISKFNSDFSSSSTVVVPNMNYPADIYYNRLNDTLAIPNSGNNSVVFVGFEKEATISFICVPDGCIELVDDSGDYITLEDCEANCQITEIEKLSNANTFFYPNPLAVGEAITLDASSQYIEVYNLQGQLVFNKTLHNTFTFELPLLKKGFYLLKTNEQLGKILIQ